MRHVVLPQGKGGRSAAAAAAVLGTRWQRRPGTGRRKRQSARSSSPPPPTRTSSVNRHGCLSRQSLHPASLQGVAVAASRASLLSIALDFVRVQTAGTLHGLRQKDFVQSLVGFCSPPPPRPTSSGRQGGACQSNCRFGSSGIHIQSSMMGRRPGAACCHRHASH